METYNYQLYVIGDKQLNSFQKPILQECMDKKSGALSLPLGCGKTLTSLVLSFYLTQNNLKPILVVCSKTLIPSWEQEIKKFFGKKVKYRVIHPETYNISEWKIKKEVQIYITTADTVAKVYKNQFISKLFISQTKLNRGVFVNDYNIPHKPYLNHDIGPGLFYSTDWGCLIIDEAQLYTNIKTNKCQALSALYSKRRWLLSGTLFDEPQAERILGYHILLNAPNQPRNLPDTKKLLKSNHFVGLNQYLVKRDTNLAFIPPKVVDKIITHPLTKEEEKIYLLMKDILVAVKEKAKQAKLLGNVQEHKKFSSYVLVMVMYLRQALICPIIPLTSIMMEAVNIEKKSALAVIIKNEVKKLHIDKYLDDQSSIESSRIKQVVAYIHKHSNENIIIFSCYASFIQLLHYVLKPIQRELFVMNKKLSIKQRRELIDTFSKTNNGVLLMTYKLGSVGLNLQKASVVMLVDQHWNKNLQCQSIGRLFRYGQINNVIYIYFFSSNTGIEKIIFEKQYAKDMIINELQTGSSKLKVPKLNMKEVIQMIEMNDNKKILQDIYF